jgi:hypothetical protein
MALNPHTVPLTILKLIPLQSKEVGVQMQDELLKVTTELQTVGSIYK